MLAYGQANSSLDTYGERRTASELVHELGGRALAGGQGSGGSWGQGSGGRGVVWVYMKSDIHAHPIYFEVWAYS